MIILLLIKVLGKMLNIILNYFDNILNSLFLPFLRNLKKTHNKLTKIFYSDKI